MTIDIVIGILLALAIYKGYRRGAVDIVASFILFVAALFVASAIGTVVGKALLGSSYLHPVIGFFIVFLVLMVIGSSIIKRIKPKKGVISGLDRIAGAGLGGLRMLLVIGLVAAFFRLFHVPSSSTMKGAVLYPAALHTTSLVVAQIKPLATSSSDEFFNDRPVQPSTQNDH